MGGNNCSSLNELKRFTSGHSVLNSEKAISIDANIKPNQRKVLPKLSRFNVVVRASDNHQSHSSGMLQHPVAPLMQQQPSDSGLQQFLQQPLDAINQQSSYQQAVPLGRRVPLGRQITDRVTTTETSTERGFETIEFLQKQRFMQNRSQLKPRPNDSN